MSLSHFDPLANLRLFEDAFSRFLSEPSGNRPWSPAVDIYETENELVLKADLPDVNQKDIDVRVENQTLTIAGTRNFEKTEDRKGFHRIQGAVEMAIAAEHQAQYQARQSKEERTRESSSESSSEQT